MDRKIAIQGYEGAFHEIAARCYFEGEELSVLALDTFDQVIKEAELQADCTMGIMAIENTISGSLLSNYNLINNSNLQITGEVFLRIKQNLLTLPGVNIDNLTEVHSHPIAIAQCREFFTRYPHIKLVENIDTAFSAKMIAEKKWEHAGAIASSLASEIYGLHILEASIETNKKNFTRFLLLENDTDVLQDEEEKVSICFTVSHKTGSLHKVLSILAFHDANLTKIQSVPLLGKPFEYLFFVDYIQESVERRIMTFESLIPFTGNLNVLGVYPKGKYYDH